MELSNATRFERGLAWTFWRVFSLWVLSDIGFYILLPQAGIEANYNISPFAVALYYLAWAFISYLMFESLYRRLRLDTDWRYSSIVLLFSATGIFLFASYILPQLPTIQWTETWSAPDLMVATSWYFLPKSFEILFQQLLIIALVLAFKHDAFSVRTTAIWCAILFGGAHMLLTFGELPFGYVVRFVIAAMAFGFVFPYILLKLRGGIIYSYAIHWAYYAITIVMAHTISPYVG
ncbi:hypothetical protein A3C91_00590 [Candidatus Azambacteria bacterium RIFCSPHIGHO2_02_FULL_52_12]|uniref:CPBP family intramembrane metalloprotease n=1 Tax=Candidatus Azambacteria bacterium RIFCSPLOWO2_01_FULL_46_25 TaxID=1797298 RepID=A0A1F5BTK5_9BACT|nr:MAG: hypothetical protein A3C91_00590 [Candidatus Azambacteria bacterium RIFCSPHIGHO2_02_FULL_52_12]OGD33951.1 MAG: hypothetical protein A2988_00460 [Candidatus Azambacteria bacterium RIFCSPLOWO2_01_FULL_46_25]OGD37637.1 MAG: hypothetical protein A2850_04535 [Candidatus Azambacteria bacterium RIFCSPHIGHO2_01_FULL_51_74]